MDGAGKFVRGDAIAGIIITAINIVGGLVIGVARENLAVEDAFQTYTRLTVGRRPRQPDSGSADLDRRGHPHRQERERGRTGL